MADIDQSVINFTRHVSLEHRRADLHYKFSEISIPVQTVQNNGMIGDISGDFIPENAYINKCFFIALAQGLEDIGCLAIDLMSLCGFTDRFEMVDTDIMAHRHCLEKLVGLLSFLQIHIYVGQKHEDQWFVSPDLFTTFGDGNEIIRILNKGAHFELIITDQSAFPRRIQSMTNEKAFWHQNEIMKKVEQINSDHLYALSLAEYDE